MELYEKIYVKPSFLETDHGGILCEDCHGGNPEDPEWQTAHKGVVKDPTFPNAERVCGECHADIVATAQNSLHYTLAPFTRTIKVRANKHDKAVLAEVCRAAEKHCNACHGSCGQCHISRPDYVKGGFLRRHHFVKTPPMDTTCASCHGGRVHGEYTGANEIQAADVHYEEEEMACLDCHTAREMHAAAGGVSSRFDLPERPRCVACHADVASKESASKTHGLHLDKVACQVCHAQPNKNCFSCHVGTDKKGLKYFKNKETRIFFKIGLNPNKTKDRPYDYVVLRHPPADPGLFDTYVKNGLSDFNTLPTWKLDTPHNLQRTTPQNRACNNCHGNAALFLSKADLAPWEVKANAAVVVPADRIPKPVKEEK